MAIIIFTLSTLTVFFIFHFGNVKIIMSKNWPWAKMYCPSRYCKAKAIIFGIAILASIASAVSLITHLF